MDIRLRPGSKWIVEVWSSEPDPLLPSLDGYDEPYPEDVYVEVNDWCKETLGYHARTAYNIFKFKQRKHLDWFLLRWS